MSDISAYEHVEGEETVKIKVTFPEESFTVLISEEDAASLEEDNSLAGDILDMHISDAQHDWDWNWEEDEDAEAEAVEVSDEETTVDVVELPEDLTNLGQYDKLILSLTIFKKYETQGAGSYISAEHDVIFGPAEEILTDEDKATLFALGWHSGDYESIEFFV